MNIQFVDLKAQYNELRNEIDAAIRETINKSDYILGEGVDLFEREFADYCGVKYGVGVHSGLASLELALKVLGIGEGDEVITVSNSFVATALAISNVGAKVVLVDCGEDFMIDTRKIAEVITPKTKAIMPVNLFGAMPDYFNIAHLARVHQLWILEDASQSHGAKYGDGKAGSFGDISCFSLYAGKNLGAFGDAGIVVTNSVDIQEKLKKIRNYGSLKKYYHEEIGTNSRLSTLQARILSVKLKHLDGGNIKRNLVANIYTHELFGVGDIKTPISNPNNYNVWHLYVIQTEKRDELQAFLKEKGIPTQIHYPIPIHRQECYKNELFYNSDEFPVTDRMSETMLSIPVHPYLTLQETTYITSTIKSFYNGR